MAIKHWPEGERPREKLINQGPRALSDAELLAIFLRTGIAGQSAVGLARDLLTQFGSISTLLNADLTTFCDVKGLGPAKFAQLQSVLELARRHLGEQLTREQVFTNPKTVRQFVRTHFQGYQREVFLCLFLDTRHCLIACEELFQGTIDSASVYPREVVKRALQINAGAVIFSHNHPSGIAEPSGDDVQITQRLKEALGLVDIRVLDHIVVGHSEEISLAERGLL
ncbi:MAG: DNA repair protein RadC [Porticoccaceae bacterium]|nr:DNA repair protein RadC [Porticoccaceae bacterium]